MEHAIATGRYQIGLPRANALPTRSQSAIENTAFSAGTYMSDINRDKRPAIFNNTKAFTTGISAIQPCLPAVALIGRWLPM